MNSARIKDVVRTLDGIELKENMPLAPLTNIGTGGRASLFIKVERISALKTILPAIEGPWFVLGGGTNLLISDRDFEGTIIQLGKNFRRLSCLIPENILSRRSPPQQAGQTGDQKLFPGFRGTDRNSRITGRGGIHECRGVP